MSVQAFIALGSNLHEPVDQIERAIAALDVLAGCKVEARSPLYCNDPIGPQPQPEFVNAVVELRTALDPHELLKALKAVELSMGRAASGARWGPRVIDLDLLLYADREIRDQDLTIPHPEMSNRRFVLEPLFNIAPDLVVPGLGMLSEVLKRAPNHEMRILSPGAKSPSAALSAHW